MVEGIYRLTQSDPSTSPSTSSGRGSGQSLEGAVNLGGSEYVTVAELVQTVIAASGKKIQVRYVEGPVGVHSRNFDKARSRALGWEARVSLREGIARTYSWIAEQVQRSRG